MTARPQQERELVQSTVYVAGSAIHGQCGLTEDKITSWTPLRVSLEPLDKNEESQETAEDQVTSIAMFGSRQSIDHQIVKVRCGGNFSLFLMRNGQVFGIGDSQYGNYGRVNDDKKDNYRLFELRALRQKNIVDLATGFNFSYLLTSDGRLFRCGSNSYSQLSNQVDYSHADVLISPVDQSLFDGFPVVQVSCGGNFVYALTSDNKLYVCGQDGTESYSVFTRVNLPPSADGQIITKISCGAYHSVVLMYNGVQYGHGSQLFPGEINTVSYFHEIPFPMKVRDVICGYNYFMCIGEDGKLYGNVGLSQKDMIMDGQLGSIDKCDEPYENFVVIQFEYPISEVITGSSSTTTLVILSNGDIYGTGCNDSGGLGLGDTENRAEFEKLPRSVNQSMAVAAATGAYHSVICYYDDILHTNWQRNLWRTRKENKLTDLDIFLD